MNNIHPIWEREHGALCDALRNFSKGYTGKLKSALLTAAHVIHQYGTDKPFVKHVEEHAYMYAAVGAQAAHNLAMACLQSDRYHDDPEFRDVVDDVLAITNQQTKVEDQTSPQIDGKTDDD
jgi:hypothetical protein